MRPYPLKFRPIYKKRIWGGRKLREFFHKDIPAGERIGESWLLADLPDNKSVIANGHLAGRTLEAVIKEYPGQITGDDNFKLPFPLLIKFLDAQDILSVQVHPDAAACKKMGKGQPKTECWYIIDAEDGAVIYKGLKKGVTKEQFRQAIEKGNVADMLAKVPVEKGQCHFLPAGTVHSIGAGILLAEIQTPSDTTYRVFDFDRVNENGKPRQLHIQEALECIHFDASADSLPVTTGGRLADCRYFKLDKHKQQKNAQTQLSAGAMRNLIILSGRGEIGTAPEIAVDFNAGDCLLVPAAYDGPMRFTADTEYLEVTL